ncbi:MAG: L-lysine 6-transaminase [Chloroflexota bacterium]|nr:L-lysine 6-transaminase [Chloroflexota bacterium]
MKPSQVHKTLSKYMLATGEDIVVDLERSHGAYVYDALEEREYIDFFTYFASIPIAHNHPKMHDSDFVEELLAASLSKPSSSDFYTTPMAKFVDTFGRIAAPESMQHLFFVSGGALAVENALKTAFDWKVRKNIAKIQNTPDFAQNYTLEGLGSKVIHFQEAFHGRTGYTMSLTNTADPRKYSYFPKFDWPRIVNPKLRFPVTDEVLTEVIQVEAVAIAQIEAALKRYPGDIAALIIEPIQGEGGDHHFRPEFFQALRALADEHEFLFIVDEVQSGMGVTGKWWAIEHMGVMPDIIAFGKKAQVCGIIASSRIDEVENNVFQESSRNNSTWGGSLADMVRSNRYLEIIAEDNLVEHTAKMGKILKSGLQDIADNSNGIMSNVRGRGMMIAFDLPDQEKRDETKATFKKNGLYCLPCGEKSIRFRGMLDTPKEVVDKALKIVEKSL